MLDKNDRKYIIRRIITYIAIATIMFFISSCQAKALVSTMPWNFSINLAANEDYNQYLFNFKDLWTDKGTGFVYFNVNYKGFSGQGVSYAPRPIKEMYLIDSNNYRYECILGDITSYWDSYVEEKNISVKCPIDFVGSTLRGVLIISPHSGSYGAQTYNFSEYATFVSENINNMSGVQQSIDNVNNSLNDNSSPSSSDIGGNSSDWNSYNTSSGTINDLVLMPITLLNSFVNGINNSCSSYDLGELWGEHLILPCINLSQTLGSVWTLIDIIISGVFIFVFGKQCVKIFNDFTNLKSGQIDTLYGGGN